MIISIYKYRFVYDLFLLTFKWTHFTGKASKSLHISLLYQQIPSKDQSQQGINANNKYHCIQSASNCSK